MSEPYDRRPEPEIIPPGVPLPRDRGAWATADIRRTHYVYASQIGPVGLTLLTLGIGAASVLGLLFLLSAAVVGVAAIGALVIAGVIAGLLRGPPRPLR